MSGCHSHTVARNSCEWEEHHPTDDSYINRTEGSIIALPTIKMKLLTWFEYISTSYSNGRGISVLFQWLRYVASCSTGSVPIGRTSHGITAGHSSDKLEENCISWVDRIEKSRSLRLSNDFLIWCCYSLSCFVQLLGKWRDHLKLRIGFVYLCFGCGPHWFTILSGNDGIPDCHWWDGGSQQTSGKGFLLSISLSNWSKMSQMYHYLCICIIIYYIL